MSVTGHTPGLRHPDDYYATPAWCTRAILPHLRPRSSFCDNDTVIDPCCGDGAILDVLAEAYPHARGLGIELNEGRHAIASAKGHAAIRGDALGPLPWASGIELVVMNPPFKLSMEFVERSLQEVQPGGTVAVLLRLAWLASQKRAAWLRKNTPSVYVLPKRPSFTGKGTDSTDYGWFVWTKGAVCGGPTVRILEVPA